MPLKNFTLKKELTENCYGDIIFFVKVKGQVTRKNSIILQKLQVIGNELLYLIFSPR